MQVVNNEIVKLVDENKLVLTDAIVEGKSDGYWWANSKQCKFEKLTDEEKLQVDELLKQTPDIVITPQTKLSSKQAEFIAKNICKHLGGGRFVAAVGVKLMVFDSDYFEGCLTIHLKTLAAKKIKYIKIYLKNDLYTMEFINSSCITVAVEDGLYDDMLPNIFTQTTQLYINIF